MAKRLAAQGGEALAGVGFGLRSAAAPAAPPTNGRSWNFAARS